MLLKLGINLTIIGTIQVFFLQVVSLTTTKILSMDVDVFYSINLLKTSAILIPALFIVVGIVIMSYSLIYKNIAKS
ncbi:hypothetical protein HXA34_01525 [Salipaludibacillus agaradhaerens]|jgi:hypothetical protein|uniref:Uncharacterized protein n=1 Tax=Salipaludibacillus agaradhaerens TaxID=76935 RepID=A0A9Q4B4I3_SALAG|nr:hypothetical protein [Salipaludibacillus agaradhaerens]MCR6098184.1 hypothetical protein [Salipaludibacillus agaradhaerens]MCR6104963.1 hypothetical protein [Salipaludibacillus agaradhaerens]MCR6116186.1 hypothetical protein [Salipaludibacillus agaradhaerens]MCR6117008.1 hypothetical protein [Salipaludibacillus agaradhaerens]